MMAPQTMEPLVALSADAPEQLPRLVIASEVVVALLKSDEPSKVVEPSRFEATELKAPEMVEEPVVRRVLRVARPEAVSVPNVAPPRR